MMQKHIAMAYLLTSNLVMAQDFDGIIPTTGVGTKIQDGTVSLNDIPAMIIGLIDMLTKIAGSIAVIMLIIGGFQLILSGATEEKESAKKTITYSIVGIIVAFSAWIIVNVIMTQITG